MVNLDGEKNCRVETRQEHRHGYTRLSPPVTRVERDVGEETKVVPASLELRIVSLQKKTDKKIETRYNYTGNAEKIYNGHEEKLIVFSSNSLRLIRKSTVLFINGVSILLQCSRVGQRTQKNRC